MHLFCIYCISLEREEKYRNVTHQNDVWHGAKNIAKKITAVSKKTSASGALQIFFI